MNDFWLIKTESRRYIVAGVVTIVVNIIMFQCLIPFFQYIIANTISFLITVMVAYTLNCIFVFRIQFSVKSFLLFFCLRIGTFFVDSGVIIFLIEKSVSPLISKCISNILVVVLNYILSKLLIFKN